MALAKIKQIQITETRRLLIVGKCDNHGVSERNIVGVSYPHPSPPTNFSNR